MKYEFKGNTMYDRVKGVVVRKGNIVESSRDMIALHPGLFTLVPDSTELTVLESSNLRRIDPRLLKPKCGIGADIPHLDKPVAAIAADPDGAFADDAADGDDAPKTRKSKKG